jgi:hypothetical protein
MDQEKSLKYSAINQYSRNQTNFPTSNRLLELLVRTDSRPSDRYPVIPQARSLLLFTVFGLYCLSHVADISSLRRRVIILSSLYA